MNKIQRYQTIIRQLCLLCYTPQTRILCARNYSIGKDSSEHLTDMKKHKIDVTDSKSDITEQFFKSIKNLETEDNVTTSNHNTFTALLRYSKFINLGDPINKLVVGEVFNIVNNDLYIDFGWKFHCVCPTPQSQVHLFKRGTKVKLLIKDLELSTRFLGATTDLTLLEADCIVISLL